MTTIALSKGRGSRRPVRHGEALLKPLDQAAFCRLLDWRQAAVSDIAGQNRINTFVEGDHDITTT